MKWALPVLLAGEGSPPRSLVPLISLGPTLTVKGSCLFFFFTVKILQGSQVLGLPSLLKITRSTALLVWVGFHYRPATLTANGKGLMSRSKL